MLKWELEFFFWNFRYLLLGSVLFLWGSWNHFFLLWAFLVVFWLRWFNRWWTAYSFFFCSSWSLLFCRRVSILIFNQSWCSLFFAVYRFHRTTASNADAAKGIFVRSVDVFVYEFLIELKRVRAVTVSGRHVFTLSFVVVTLPKRLHRRLGWLGCMCNCLFICLIGLVLFNFNVFISVKTLYFHIHAISPKIAINIDYRWLSLGCHFICRLCLRHISYWFFIWKQLSFSNFTLWVHLFFWRGILWLGFRKRRLVDERWCWFVCLVFGVSAVKKFVILLLSSAFKHSINWILCLF